MTLHQSCLLLLQCFVKTVNYQHMMPTRYALDVDLKNVVTSESLENSSKRTSARKVNTCMSTLCMHVAVLQSGGSREPAKSAQASRSSGCKAGPLLITSGGLHRASEPVKRATLSAPRFARQHCHAQ